MFRRRFIVTTASAVPFGLAGCTGGSDDETPTPGESPTPTATAAPTDTAAATDTVAGTDPPTGTDSPTGTESPTDEPTAVPNVAAEVTVAPDGDFRFEPETVTVQTGEAVRWVWEAAGHNVKPGDVPADSDWTGTPGSRSETFDSGYEHVHTFEVAGTYDYVCVPHEGIGMVGTVIVE